MAEEKIIDAGKKEDKSQDKFANERLTEDELDKVAGGFVIEFLMKYLNDLTQKNSDKPPGDLKDPGELKSHPGTSGK